MKTKMKKNDLMSMVDGYTFDPVFNGRSWLVTTPKGMAYSTYPRDATCTCPARTTCKHLRAIWTFESLIPSLTG